MRPAIEILESPQAVAAEAARRTRTLAAEAIRARGRFVLALSGGSTPKIYHQILAADPALDWSKIFIVFSDERAVPGTDSQSNYRMAEETLLSKIPAKFARIRADDGDSARAARDYEAELSAHGALPVDLLILGMGEDGHTASLFPGATADDRAWLQATDAPPTAPVKPRVTFTYRAIAAARSVLALITGASKASRLAEVLGADGSLPMQRVIRERTADLQFIVDRSAAAALKGDFMTTDSPLTRADFGLIGLGVMGQNLALNIEEKGFSIAVNNRSTDKIDEFLRENPGKKIIGARSLKELAERLTAPRRLIIMVKAGAAVDSTIDALLPFLEKGDVVIDGGNEFFTNTERRAKALEAAGIHFVGMGVSGGEEGARHGPSLMPGGPDDAYAKIKDVVTKIAAQVEDGPCVTHIGPGGAGHYVKMVHNGIEYGDMQLIAEAYDVMKNVGGLSNAELAEVFEEWNRAELESFLIEITAKIFRKKDDLGGSGELLDKILDAAQMKGTGSWTVKEGADLQAAIPTIASSVDARVMSALHPMRQRGAEILRGPAPAQSTSAAEKAEIVADARAALYAAKACSYAQGLALLSKASATHNWSLNLGEIARIWKGGCIIRAAFLKRIQTAFRDNTALENLLFNTDFRDELAGRQNGWRRTITRAINAGIAMPSMTASLAYYDQLRRARSPMNLTQAQRDFFGAHTFARVDREGVFHAEW